ncbi:hypothetical protein EBB07_33420 [Paenibacillaceae bacterium]|nr:hypothetical protein EBB07_33420 [Paenibacillaceae bacterium]
MQIGVCELNCCDYAGFCSRKAEMLAKLRENPAHLQQFLQKWAKAPPNPAYLQYLKGARPLIAPGLR